MDNLGPDEYSGESVRKDLIEMCGREELEAREATAADKGLALNDLHRVAIETVIDGLRGRN